jgi:hypothetical protein
MGGREVGVLPDFGKRVMALCDMRRVLMTQMGFVTMVLVAPAVTDE